MATPSLFKKITDVQKTSAYSTGSLEVACRAQIGDYTNGTVNIQDVAYDETSSMLCAVGNYFSDGTAVNTGGDTIAAQYIPLVGVVTVNALTIQDATWVLTPQFDSVNIVLQTPNSEQSALVKVIALPSGVSTNWTNETWLAVGHANTDMATKGPGFNAMIAPNSNQTPLIVSVRTAGTTLYESSMEANSRPSWAWTDTGGVSTSNFNPMLLGDIVYSPENDQIVCVGSSVPDSGGAGSAGMIVESDFGGAFDTFSFYIGSSVGGSPNGPCTFRTVSIQETDVAGATVANRTLCLVGGVSNSATINGTGSLWLYQPDFSNAWPGGQPRVKPMATGLSDVSGFWREFVQNTSGGTANDVPTMITAIDKVSDDGEDIYVMMGTSFNGPFMIFASGLSCGATGAPTVFDNEVVAAGVDVKFDEIEWKSLALQGGLPAGITGISTRAALTCIGLTQRKTKAIAGGIVDLSNILPVSSSTGATANGFLISMSRAGLVFNTDVQDNGELPQNTAAFIIVSEIPNNEDDKFFIINSRLGGVAFTSPTSGSMTNIASAQPITNHTAKAYFEYILYDGVDALIAKKLQQLGVRVTITNLEWYKQDILKQGLDLDADFFREWSSSQVGENEKREKLAENYGSSRLQKRAVRTELFDDYNNREEILAEMDRFRQEDPTEDTPYSDEVADTQEEKKIEKSLDDKIRIENLVDEETDNQNKT